MPSKVPDEQACVRQAIAPEEGSITAAPAMALVRHAPATEALDAKTCRASRKALGCSVARFAAMAGVSEGTITKFERGGRLLPAKVTAIRTALKAAGFEFIADDGGGSGMLRQTRQRRTGWPIEADALPPPQIRAARELLLWSAPRLAQAAGVHRATVQNAEAGLRLPNPYTRAAIRQALEAAGIEFTAGNDDASGVRLRKPKPA